jgi:hypothetical protein
MLFPFSEASERSCDAGSFREASADRQTDPVDLECKRFPDSSEMTVVTPALQKLRDGNLRQGARRECIHELQALDLRFESTGGCPSHTISWRQILREGRT